MTDRDVASAADFSHGAAPVSNPPAAASPDRDEALRQIAERLHAGREQQRLTVDDLATRLKVAPGKLLAVESADVGALPDMTFAKGLIRAYARALQVDVDDQLARLNARAPVTNIGLRPEGGLGESFSDKPSFGKRRGANSRWLVGVLVAVAVAAGALAAMDRLKHWFTTQTAATQNAESDAKEAPAAEQAAPAQVAPAPEQPSAEAPAASMPTPLTPVAPAAPASGVVTAPLAPPPTLPRSDSGAAAVPAVAAVGAKPAVMNVDAPVAAVATEGAKPAASASDSGSVSVHFSGASWYEIKDKSGKTLASGISKEGDTRELSGTPPFKVVFGNAEAVASLAVGGASVDIQKYARNRVARATLP
ncbi:RodZ domain-containing protein [Ralstonia soli]|uniref:Helix-turn-helix domain-containing protein n=1 Tax=Ralstonia soli TaxID=2953896 RepID=A0ABT1AIV0_9RALS|nr:RodZ family helix-turn-helix domain-containing protein [Ralstonia soli]MCO5398042.1 helix-turn-helix domain-containing protein [Ralstonia soli]